MKKILIPKKGLKVRDPATGEVIPEEGAVKKLNSFFRRRINDGDLTLKNNVLKKPTKNQKIKETKPKSGSITAREED